MLDGSGRPLETQKLDDFSLGRGELTHLALVVRCEVVDHMHERTDQILQRLLVEEVEQHNVSAVVAGGEVVYGTRPRPAERRAEKVCQIRFVLVDGLLGEQVDSGFEGRSSRGRGW